MAHRVSGGESLLAVGLLGRIQAGETVYGTFLSMGSAVSAEIAGRAGFDWVLFDLEHGAGGEYGLLGLLHAVAAGGTTTTVVRVESAARLRIGRVLDLGAAGVMLPRIDTAAQAREAIGWLRYPPRGERGVALMSRSGGYGTLTHGGVGAIDESILGIVQIESPSAVEEAGEIAAVEGADVLFVGPTDLSHTLGIPGDFEHPRYVEAVEHVAAVCTSAGKSAGVLARSIEEARSYIDRGYRFIGVGSDAALLVTQFRGLVAALQSAGAGN
jgi:2-dehydro-3-deoxyglucarate aldolase/4-hydroxy-2-oxoheptanedioate aldolase